MLYPLSALHLLHSIGYFDLQNELNIEKQRVISAEQYAATMEQQAQQTKKQVKEANQQKNQIQLQLQQRVTEVKEKKDESERSKEEVENKLKLATSWCEQLDTQLRNRKQKKEEMLKRLAKQFNVQRQNIYDECNRRLSAKDEELKADKARITLLMKSNEAWAKLATEKANLQRQYHQHFCFLYFYCLLLTFLLLFDLLSYVMFIIFRNGDPRHNHRSSYTASASYAYIDSSSNNYYWLQQQGLCSQH